MRTSKLILSLLLALCIPCKAALTTVTDTVHRADGTNYTGDFRVSWATFTNASNVVIRAGYINVTVNSGSFSVTLEPTGTCIAYLVEYRGLRQGVRQIEYWVVPATGPVGLVTVRRNSLPICPPNTNNAFPCTFTSQTTITCTHNRNSINVGVEVEDTSGFTMIPDTIHRTDLNTVVVVFSVAVSGTVLIL